MSEAEPQPAASEASRLRPSPSWLVAASLAATGLLWLSDHFGLLSWHKGYAVLTAVASVGVAILLMLLWFIASLLLRSRFQFSIRSLLVLTIAVALPCSWLAVEMQAANRQAEAADWIRNAGGGVTHDGVSYPDGSQRPDDELPATAWLRSLLGIDFFSEVIQVSLFNSEVADADLERLTPLTRLEELYLEGNPITDAGLVHLQGFQHLDTLSLNKTQVTDRGLKQLDGLDQLAWLGLSFTRVTAAGLQSLQRLPRLRQLYLKGDQITATELDGLQRTLPGCYIGT
jgi:hypothetical protein